MVAHFSRIGRGAIAGCHGRVPWWGAIAGCQGVVVHLGRDWTWCHCRCHCSVPGGGCTFLQIGRGANAGRHCWMPWWGARGWSHSLADWTWCHCWVPWCQGVVAHFGGLDGCYGVCAHFAGLVLVPLLGAVVGCQGVDHHQYQHLKPKAPPTHTSHNTRNSNHHSTTITENTRADTRPTNKNIPS